MVVDVAALEASEVVALEWVVGLEAGFPGSSLFHVGRVLDL